MFENMYAACHAAFALQRPQLILFVPVFMALGIAGYFALPEEPAFFWGGGGVFVFASALLLFKNNVFRLCLGAGLLIVLGFCAAQIRTHLVYTPLLEDEISFAEVEGDVIALEALEKGVRVLLDNVVIEDMPADETPRRVRLKLWQSDAVDIGQRVRVLASLMPPSPPLVPGGFDFQRYMYFKGIGALGFIYKPLAIIDEGEGRFTRSAEKLRRAVDDNIAGVLEGARAGLAMALMTGRRSAMPEDDLEAIRASGLAHMLAISGLHVGLFSGFIFFVARFAMAGFPAFALRHPVKKYAAVIALVGAFIYMLLAGATIPTQRAMLSVAVVFTAILLDRSPITLRVVAFAAFVILLFFPESLMSASFQMSFAAVSGLVAFYEWIRPVWSKWHRQAGILRRAGLYFLGVSMTTVVATLATAPFALFHFQQLASYGLFANFICVPVLAFLVMPMAVLAFVLMPFGLEGLALLAMQPGLDLILHLSRFTAGLDGSVIMLPSFSTLSFVFLIFSGLSLVVLRGGLRGVTCFVFATCGLVAFEFKHYDLLISRDFVLVGIKGAEDILYVSDKRKERFVQENWAELLGMSAHAREPFPREGVIHDADLHLRCGEAACRFRVKGMKGAFVKSDNPSILAQECAWAELVIARHADVRECDAPYALNKYDGYRYGAHAITVRGGVPLIERVEDRRGARLWTGVTNGKSSED